MIELQADSTLARIRIWSSGHISIWTPSIMLKSKMDALVGKFGGYFSSRYESWTFWNKNADEAVAEFRRRFAN
jgi:hypothetical protein